jgi:hypothetical protein
MAGAIPLPGIMSLPGTLLCPTSLLLPSSRLLLITLQWLVLALLLVGRLSGLLLARAACYASGSATLYVVN